MTRILALLMVLSAPSAVLAQAGNKAQAKALYKEGKGHYGAGRFGEAIKAFNDANGLRPHPLMLYNIGSAYEAMGDVDGAIRHYELYLQSNPDDAATVSKEVSRLKRQLKAGWAPVEVSSTPSGASIWRTDQTVLPLAQTPATVMVPVGPQVIVLSRDGYDPAVIKVTVKLGETTQVAAALPKAQPKVRFSTHPEGALVAFDDAEGPAGQTPLTFGLKPGKHVAHISKAGFEPINHPFEITEEHLEAPLVVPAFTLQKALPSGHLAVTVNLDGAQVSIDGKPVGISPLPEPLRLSEGLHTLDVTHPEQSSPHTEKVAIVAGKVQRTEVEIQTSLISSSFELDQAFWSYSLIGLGGALVIGGGVTGALAFGDSGSLDDCRSNPECVGSGEESDLVDSVGSKALTTDILVGVGLATVGAGLYLLLTDDDDDAPSGDVGIVPMTGGAAAFGRFEF